MIRYSYYYNSNLDIHVVMVTRDNADGTICVRPVMAYYSEKTAKAYIEKVNTRIATHDHSYLRTNPPIRYFHCPDWWVEKFPNWNKMYKGV